MTLIPAAIVLIVLGIISLYIAMGFVSGRPPRVAVAVMQVLKVEVQTVDGRTELTSPRLRTAIVTTLIFLGVGLPVTGVFLLIAVALIIEGDQNERDTVANVTAPATAQHPTSPQTPSPETVAPAVQGEICGTTWEVTGGPGGGTFEFESAETRNGGIVCRYTELNNIGDFFGEGTATVQTNGVHLEGFDSFIGDYETDLEIRGDSMLGEKDGFPLTLHRQ